ncbi:hypothetical protein [Pseudorhodobacter sp.]|uniref:hypothetical protein n=1 Tax=Pseudorhodobacter sp. TaxID=1934400 RepID=UPI0039E4BA3D
METMLAAGCSIARRKGCSFRKIWAAIAVAGADFTFKQALPDVSIGGPCWKGLAVGAVDLSDACAAVRGTGIMLDAAKVGFGLHLQIGVLVQLFPTGLYVLHYRSVGLAS